MWRQRGARPRQWTAAVAVAPNTQPLSPFLSLHGLCFLPVFISLDSATTDQNTAHISMSQKEK